MICTTLIWRFVMTAFNNCFIIWLSSLFTVVIFRYLLIQLSISWVAYSLQGKGSEKLLHMTLLLFVSSNWQVMLNTLAQWSVRRGLAKFFKRDGGERGCCTATNRGYSPVFTPWILHTCLKKKGGSKPAAARVPTATW